MVRISFPTSQDIFIEINGRKLAVVESYRVKSSQNSRYIEAFGQSEPVGTVSGGVKHVIHLSKLYICCNSGTQGFSFYDLHDFNLVIVKPDRRIIYSGCEWSSIQETASLNQVVLENIELIAAKRMEFVS